MADLADMLKGILDDPDTAGKLRSLLGGESEGGQKEEKSHTEDIIPGGFDPVMMAKLARAFKNMNGKKSDDRMRLLYDLKPYISKERCKRVDEAAEILRMIWVLDIFREEGFDDK